MWNSIAYAKVKNKFVWCKVKTLGLLLILLGFLHVLQIPLSGLKSLP